MKQRLITIPEELLPDILPLIKNTPFAKKVKELLENADELLNTSDREIMALSLGKNEKWSENYQMAINIKLRKTLMLLNLFIAIFFDKYLYVSEIGSKAKIFPL